MPLRCFHDRSLSQPAVAVALTALVCGACAGGPSLPSLPQSLSGPGLPNVSIGSIQGEATHQPLPSAEVYARIARGANACWFGARGRLGKSHILHADAAPSMNGGAVEVVVHERAVDQPKPWGYKAYRIVLTEGAGIDGTPGSGGTSIAVENSRIPDAEAARMRAEVYQWAAGTEGCRHDPALDKVAEPVAEAAPPPKVAKAPKGAATKAAPKATASGGEATEAAPRKQ